MYTTPKFVVLGVPPLVERIWPHSTFWNFMFFVAFFVYVSLSAVGWLLPESQSADSQEHHIELAYLLFYLFFFFTLFYTMYSLNVPQLSLYTLHCLRSTFVYNKMTLNIYHFEHLSFFPNMCKRTSREVKTNEAKTKIDFRKTNLNFFVAIPCAWIDSENWLCHHSLWTF